MYFSFAFCTVATALVLVQGQEFNHPEPEGPHKYTQVGHCKNMRNEFMISRINAALKPRERHVVLKPEKGFEFDPSTVTVKRCMGACSERLSPMPMKSEPKSFVVQLKRRGEHEMPTTCVSVTVMEHTVCKCMCMRDERSCNERQKWIQSKCGCDCKEEIRSRVMNGKVWSNEKCSYECRDNEGCLNGMRWDDHNCRCIRK